MKLEATTNNEFSKVLEIYQAIYAVHWPPGSNQFVLYPERKGNGVKPIKDGCMTALYSFGWHHEKRMKILKGLRPGPVDALRTLNNGKQFVVEWETGNGKCVIKSSSLEQNCYRFT